MPAKVIEPNGNQVVNGIENCGYLERADKPLDDQDALQRIPFINDLKLEYGDLVVYEPIPDCTIHVKVKNEDGEDVVKKGKITMAEVKYDPNLEETWNNKDFTKKWKKWSDVTDKDIIDKLKLKDKVTPQIISEITDADDYKSKKQKKDKSESE